MAAIKVINKLKIGIRRKGGVYVGSKPVAWRLSPTPFPFVTKFREVSITEGRNTAWEGIFAEEGREEVGGAGYAGGGRLSDLVSSLVGREVDVAWSPMNLQVKYIA